jgi:exosome complex RNA-binding protein Rrp4
MTTSLLASIIGTLNVPFETAIGMNGRIWINGSTPLHTIALKRVLEAVDRRVIDGEDKDELGRWMKQEGVMLQ